MKNVGATKGGGDNVTTYRQQQATRRRYVFATATTTTTTTVMACNVVIRCIRVLSQLQWKREDKTFTKASLEGKNIIDNLTVGKTVGNVWAYTGNICESKILAFAFRFG